MNSENPLFEARGEFIEKMYPALFGPEEMGDVAGTFEPSDITGILVAYEQCLAANGLLKIVDIEKE